MALLSAFQYLGKSVTLITNAAASSTQRAFVLRTEFFLTQWPQALRMVNNGTVDIWVSFTQAGTAAAFPVGGTTTAGTPSAGFRLKPGIVEIFGWPTLAPNPSALHPQVPGFFVNSIASLGAQPFDMTPGEGL